ncbi:MAG: putative transcriptional regulator [Ilumatobacteraceae bacterium]|nr:putative transcriptional regulator [Ilumatobacteraceae bacterium]
MTETAGPSSGGPGLRLDDLVGLDLFVDAVRLGSISAAAREHHVSQPSATERVRTLERRLGVKLLRRGPGGSAPTPEGEAVAQWARELLDAVAHMAEGVAAMREPSARHPLRIMASLTVAEYVMPMWLHAHRVAGGAPVELAVGNSVVVARAVTEGQVQLGFVETPRRMIGLRTAVVGGDELTVVVAPGHPWARRRAPLTPAILAETPLLLREPGSGTRDAFEAALAAARPGRVSTSIEPLAVLASTTTLKSATAAGDGASVLSRLAVEGDIASGRLVAVPVQGLDLHREFRAVWRPSEDDAAVQRFVRLAKSVRR